MTPFQIVMVVVFVGVIVDSTRLPPNLTQKYCQLPAVMITWCRPGLGTDKHLCLGDSGFHQTGQNSRNFQNDFRLWVHKNDYFLLSGLWEPNCQVLYHRVFFGCDEIGSQHFHTLAGSSLGSYSCGGMFLDTAQVSFCIGMLSPVKIISRPPFFQDYRRVDQVWVSSTAEIKIDERLNIKQTNTNNDITKVRKFCCVLLAPLFSNLPRISFR